MRDGSGEVTVDRQLLEAAKTDTTRRRRAHSWAALIQRVWEVDPLQCTKCGGQMRVIRFIEARQEEVIRRILQHCGLWQGPLPGLPPARPPPVQKRPPPPREVQLVLDPEFTPELRASGATPGRHLVLDPECLAERQSQAEAQQVMLLYE